MSHRIVLDNRPVPLLSYGAGGQPTSRPKCGLARTSIRERSEPGGKMRGGALWTIAMVLVLAASGAQAAERKTKQLPDLADKKKLEEFIQLLKKKEPETLRTKPTPAESAPQVEEGRAPSKSEEKKAPRASKKEDEEEKGLLPSLKRVLNETNDYFIDKNGDGVSDWWEKRKSVKVKPKPPETKRKTRKDTDKEKRRR